MIKLFRNIRKNLLSEGKTAKYFKYAIGEIVLVVIGILIALQINNWNENKNKTKLGHQYLMEMKSELQDDAIKLDRFIIELKKSIENQEAALNTNDISKLPLDSLVMIISPINLDFKISELTYNKMNNLGISSLSNNDSLNSNILEYYNSDVVYLKSSMTFIFNDLVKYTDFQLYEQDKIDLNVSFSATQEFPSLYKQSEEESIKESKSNLIEFIYSIKGRNLILYDLSNKKYSLGVLNRIQGKTVKLLESIYNELKINNPEIKPLPLLPSEIKFEEIVLSLDILESYSGTYKGDSYNIIVLVEDKRIYFEFANGSKDEISPYEKNKFFAKNDPSVIIQFNEEKGKIKSLTVNNYSIKEEFNKLK